MTGNEIVLKKDLSADDLKTIRKALIIRNPKFSSAERFSQWKASEIPEFIQFFKEEKDRLLLPRNSLKILNIDAPSEVFCMEGLNAKIDFFGELRDYQKEFVETIDFSEDDMIFSVPCGHGKTLMALWYLAKLKKKAIIFVNTNFLVSQWFNRLRVFTYGNSLEFTEERTLCLSSKINNISNIYSIIESKDIIITTIQTYNNLNNKVKDAIGRTRGIEIYDEAHRLGAETYYPVLEDSIIKKRLALTATFRRGDNLQQILQFHFGSIYKMESKLPPAKTYCLDTGCKVQSLIEKEKLSNVKLFKAILDESKEDYKETESYFSFPYSKINFSDYVDLKVKDKWWLKRVSSDTTLVHIENFLCELKSRKRMARDLIQECLDNGRTVLFLSKRKSLLKEFYEYFKNDYHCYLIVQETNKKLDLEEVGKKCQVVFGINTLAQEALDIERLDTLISYHYLSDTEQAVGRISRVLPGKKQPIFFYMRDNCSQAYGMLNKAKRFISINSDFVGTVNMKEAVKVL